MRKTTKTLIIIGLVAAAALYLNPNKPRAKETTVTRVIDGDTIEVKGYDESIRLLGVDTPESDEKDHDPGEYTGIQNNSCLVKWSEKASNYTQKNLENREITLIFDSEAGEKGSYGRYLAYIELDGNDFTKNLIEKGYARVYMDSDFKRKKSYIEAEEEARVDDKGLWNCS